MNVSNLLLLAAAVAAMVMRGAVAGLTPGCVCVAGPAPEGVAVYRCAPAHSQ